MAQRKTSPTPIFYFWVVKGEDLTENEMETALGEMMTGTAVFVAAGSCDNFSEGIHMVKDSIDSGKARNTLDRMIEFTRECRPFIRNEL